MADKPVVVTYCGTTIITPRIYKTVVCIRTQGIARNIINVLRMDSSEDNVQSAKDNLHDSSADSSGKTLLRADPRWPHLKKWLVTISSSPQVSQSVPPLKSKTLELEEDVPQTSSCVPESGEEITSSKDMISLTQNLSPVTVQDPKYACEGQQKLPSDSSLAPATSSPSPSLGAWTIPLKMSSFNSMGTESPYQSCFTRLSMGSKDEISVQSQQGHCF
ncbi:hypothetical protein Bca4012_016872 [Brassica carinata]